MNISQNEWEIMKELWKKSPRTLKQLCDSLGVKHSWTKHTIISFLKRMEIKGSIQVEQTEKRKYFFPLINEADAILKETQNLTAKVYGGNKMLMLSNIVKEQELDDSEIDELMAILKNRRK